MKFTITNLQYFFNRTHIYVGDRSQSQINIVVSIWRDSNGYFVFRKELDHFGNNSIFQLLYKYFFILVNEVLTSKMLVSN